MTQLPALDHGIKAHVERELYTYPRTVRAIAERRTHLLEGGDGRDPLDPDLPARGAAAWSDPTYYAGTALAEDRRLRELERIVGAIDAVLADVPDQYRQVITAWYWQRGRAADIAAACALSQPTVYRLRQAVIAAIAVRLGWVG